MNFNTYHQNIWRWQICFKIFFVQNLFDCFPSSRLINSFDLWKAQYLKLNLLFDEKSRTSDDGTLVLKILLILSLKFFVRILRFPWGWRRFLETFCDKVFWIWLTWVEPFDFDTARFRDVGVSKLSCYTKFEHKFFVGVISYIVSERWNYGQWRKWISNLSSNNWIVRFLCLHAYKTWKCYFRA